ncbi:hypothetical protein OKA05_27200 [Luteolibacter arcticus]|uniref:Uncharacterized protein n=1 Tax=Luteolibacter arcticus TaxID=1581411 RepID=A0ABT3GRW0_9BACT|nr:hypothetical protein [Luteolibacter arcticus]MCW1926271.1 hypothetical protein [Luteolibacter arcticus]
MNSAGEPVWRAAEAWHGVEWVRNPDIGLPVGWRVEVTGFSDGRMVAFLTAGRIENRVYARQFDFGLEFRMSCERWIP